MAKRRLSCIDGEFVDGEVGTGYLRAVGEKKPVGPAAVVEVDKIGVLGEIGAINRGVGEMAGIEVFLGYEVSETPIRSPTTEEVSPSKPVKWKVRATSIGPEKETSGVRI